MKANLTDFTSVLEKDLSNILSRRSLIDSVSSSATTAMSGAETAASGTHNAAQSAASGVSDAVESATGSAGSLEDNVAKELAKVDSNLPDFYIIGLWSYCKGSFNDTSSAITNCTSPSTTFWFNFTDVLGLESSWAEELFPSQVDSAMKVYKTASKGMTVAYIIAFSVTGFALLMGLTATLSRWGSFLTSICAVASAASNLAASATATGVYATLVGVLESVFNLSGIKASLGQRMLATTWLAAAFSLLAVPFWLASVCCCSGKPRENRKTRLVDERPPPGTNYQRLSADLSVYHGGSMGSARY
ncbi:hypothetical protein VTN00DRAFT_2755 [Thermoascus crustaceus]|uniref:uncharacterized protein n=1 Tax=Thermoascus crustaceus TaxID=5088 RepID=UPI0037443F0F